MKKAIWMIPLALVAGCFTMKQTPMPQVTLSHAAEGHDTRVAVSGFATTFVSYTPVYGYQTVYVDHGPRHHHGWYGGHYETVTSETLVPQASASDAFLTRAQTLLEDAGYLVRAPQPDYTVEVTFGGPFVTDGERGCEAAWMFLSLLSCEYTTQTWTAKLRIYDAKTGRVAMTHDYAQKFEDCVWSPLLFIGLAGYTENTPNHIQGWCLTALTDRAVADATAYLSKAPVTKIVPAKTTAAAPAAPTKK